MPSQTVVGVDVGGSKLLMVEMALDHDDSAGFLSVDLRRREKVAVDAASPTVVESIAEHSGRFVAEVAERIGEPVNRLGLGVAGLVGLDGTVTRSPNVAGVVYQDLRGAVAAAAGIHPTVDNDANCVAVAAALSGPQGTRTRVTAGPAASRADEVILAVTLGTGIGAGLVVNGSLLHGADGYACEPGHMVVQRDGIQCRCGQRGCWERYASGTAIEAFAAEAVREGWQPTEPSGKRIDPASGGHGLDGMSPVSSERVVELARSGDQVAISIVAHFSEWLAFGLQNLISLLNPTRIALGGGLAEEADLFMPTIGADVAQNPQIVGHTTEITVAPHGPAAGAVGAGMIAFASESDPH